MSPNPCNEEPPACTLAQETTVLLCAEPEVGLRAPLTRVQSLSWVLVVCPLPGMLWHPCCMSLTPGGTAPVGF